MVALIRIALLSCLVLPSALGECTNEGNNCYATAQDNCKNTLLCATYDCDLQQDFWSMWLDEAAYNANYSSLRKVSLGGCISGTGLDINGLAPGTGINQALLPNLEGTPFDIKNNIPELEGTSFFIESGSEVNVENFHVEALRIGDGVNFTSTSYDYLDSDRGGFGCNLGEFKVGKHSTISSLLTWLPIHNYFDDHSYSDLGMVHWQALPPPDLQPLDPNGTPEKQDFYPSITVGQNATVNIRANFRGGSALRGLVDALDSSASGKIVDGLNIGIQEGGYLRMGPSTFSASFAVGALKKGSLDIGKNGHVVVNGIFEHRAGGKIRMHQAAIFDVNYLIVCGGLINLDEGAVGNINNHLSICGETIISGPGIINVGLQLNTQEIQRTDNGNGVLSVRNGVQLNVKELDLRDADSTVLEVDDRAIVQVQHDVILKPQDIKIYGGTFNIKGSLTMKQTDPATPSFFNQGGDLVVEGGGTIDVAHYIIGSDATLSLRDVDMTITEIRMKKDAVLDTNDTVIANQLYLDDDDASITAKAITITKLTSIANGIHFNIIDKTAFAGEEQLVIGNNLILNGGTFHFDYSALKFGDGLTSTSNLELKTNSLNDITFGKSAKAPRVDIKEGGRKITIGRFSHIDHIVISGDTDEIHAPAAMVENTLFEYAGNLGSAEIKFVWYCGDDDNGEVKHGSATVAAGRGATFPIDQNTEMKICNDIAIEPTTDAAPESKSTADVPKEPISTVNSNEPDSNPKDLPVDNDNTVDNNNNGPDNVPDLVEEVDNDPNVGAQRILSTEGASPKTNVKLWLTVGGVIVLFFIITPAVIYCLWGKEIRRKLFGSEYDVEDKEPRYANMAKKVDMVARQMSSAEILGVTPTTTILTIDSAQPSVRETMNNVLDPNAAVEARGGTGSTGIRSNSSSVHTAFTDVQQRPASQSIQGSSDQANPSATTPVYADIDVDKRTTSYTTVFVAPVERSTLQ